MAANLDRTTVEPRPEGQGVNMDSSFGKKWTNFCQQSNWQRVQDEALFRRVVDELRTLFSDIAPPRRVLEIGCANGVLYAPLGFDRAEVYRGVDVATHMLRDFEARHPGVATIAASGHSYLDDGQYDLIFNNGTVQYFDRAMLDQLFQNATRMLAPGGRFVCATIPWKHLQLAHLRGHLRRGPLQGNRFRSLPASLLLLASHRLSGKGIGAWYDIPTFERLARRHGLAADFYGSLTSLHCFHAAFRHDGAGAAGR